MTNEQVNASRYVALRSSGCAFTVTESRVTVTCDGQSEQVDFTRDTPAETLKRNLQIAVARLAQ